jgi:hemolysin activation/secretion protein
MPTPPTFARLLTAALSLFFLLTLTIAAALGAEAAADTLRFDIKAFEIRGNTIFTGERLGSELRDLLGPDRTTDEVEEARGRVEKYYHERGYPTVLVNIPEQTIESGTIALEVIESTIRRVRVTGNRFFTMENILGRAPSFRPGAILHVPSVQRELAGINQNPDIKVAPVLIPGRELGTIDVELKVKDKLPLHGYAELNNRSSHNTTDLRLNTLIRYDNLWQKEHSITFQYQTSPEDTKEVQALSASFVLPALWSKDQIFALFGVVSNSDTSFNEGFQILGEGIIVGFRNVFPMPSLNRYTHSFTLGMDYRDFEEEKKFADDTGIESKPVTYLPITGEYAANLGDDWGATSLSLGVNFAVRGMVTQERDFEDKRYKAKGNYIYLRPTLERVQHLPLKFGLRLGVDGQIASQPLISNEQFVAGGIDSVHGYKESEAAGDEAIHLKTELFSPDFLHLIFGKDWLGLRLHGFYEYASLRLIEPLPGEPEYTELQGVGARVSGRLSHYLIFHVDWGQALKETVTTEADEQLIYFGVKAQF